MRRLIGASARPEVDLGEETAGLTTCSTLLQQMQSAGSLGAAGASRGGVACGAPLTGGLVTEGSASVMQGGSGAPENPTPGVMLKRPKERLVNHYGSGAGM